MGRKSRRRRESIIVKRQQVQLLLRASNLKPLSGILKRKPDVFATATLLGEIDKSAPKVLGKTEVIKNSLNPQWTEIFVLDYELGKPANVNVGIYDENRKTQKHKQLGSAVFDIGEVLGSRGNVKAKKLKRGGFIVARVENAPAQPSGNLTITLQGAQLKNVELIGKADPFFEVLRMDAPGGRAWLPVYRSKHIENNLNPRWEPATIDIDRLCDGDGDRPIKISVFDYEKNGKHRPIGSFETTGDDLFNARMSGNPNDTVESFALTEKGKETGRIYVSDAAVDQETFLNALDENKSREIFGSSRKVDSKTESLPVNDVQDDKHLNITLEGVRLKNIELIGKIDPFFEFSRTVDGPTGNVQLLVQRSKPIMDDVNPKWEPVLINLNQLCGGDREKPILVSVFDYEKSGKHKKLGSFDTTVNALVGAKISNTHDLCNSFILMKNGARMGRIVVSDASIVDGADDRTQNDATPLLSSKESIQTPLLDVTETVTESPSEVNDIPPLPDFPRPRFLDYISGGCELQLCVGIDFGISNGNPEMPGTFHHIDRDGKLNEYEKAISAVGSIVSKFDSDKRYPVWGFGARFCGKIQNSFQVGMNAEAQGIRGILQSYRGMFKSSMRMSSPSIITEVIKKAVSYATEAENAAQRVGNQCYTILMLLTDGSVDHLDATAETFVAASRAPLSIVIVGIGDADFGPMRYLDDFAQEEADSVRDITQFVEFRAHKNDKTSLTTATLEEIPEQLVGYFYGKGIRPNPMLTGNKLQIVPDDHNQETDQDIGLNFASSENITVTKNSTNSRRASVAVSYDFKINYLRTLSNFSDSDEETDDNVSSRRQESGHYCSFAGLLNRTMCSNTR